MRREYFTLATRLPADADDSERPTIVVSFDGPIDELQDRLTDDTGHRLPAETVDVTCRLLEEETDRRCVLGLTHRLTGEFLLEANGDAAAILEVVDAARSADEDASYRVRVEAEDGEDFVYDEETLLVYDADGSLLRRHSLIPSGVEL